MPKVQLYPMGKTLEAPRKKNLLRFLQENEVPVGSACGGNGLCASCKVTVLKGHRSLNRPNDRETDLKERNHLQTDERISCQCKILDDLEITTDYWQASPQTKGDQE